MFKFLGYLRSQIVTSFFLAFRKLNCFNLSNMLSLCQLSLTVFAYHYSISGQLFLRKSE